MAQVEFDSRARGARNEDFSFEMKLPKGHVLVVGDFASSNFEDIGNMAAGELNKIVGDPGLAEASMPVLLAHVALQLNIRLLTFKEGLGESFQCCAVFAAVSGDKLYYASFGDCRVAVRRADTISLLNGSIWTAAGGHALPPTITLSQEPVRGPDKAPSQVLGVHPIELAPGDVKEFTLERDDVILLYSDGVDKVVSPVRLLSLMPRDPVESSYKSFVEKVMTEVDIQNGDDDRTLLVAAGPHASSTGESLMSAVQKNSEAVAKANEGLGKLSRRIGSIEQQHRNDKPIGQFFQETLEEIQRNTDARVASAEEQKRQQIQTVERYFKEIQGLIDKLPTFVDLQQAISSAHDSRVTGAQIPDLDRKLDEVLAILRDRPSSDYGNIPIIRPGEDGAVTSSGAMQPATGQSSIADRPRQGSRTQAGALPAATQALSTTAAVMTKEANAGDLQEAAARPQRLDRSGRFREGVLLIANGRLSLVDEGDVPPDAYNGTEHIYLLPPHDARPGWCTAWFLLLLAGMQVNDSEAPDVTMKRILDYDVEPLNKLDDATLLSLRSQHQKIRDRRRRGNFFRRWGLGREEKGLAADVAGRLGTPVIALAGERPHLTAGLLRGVSGFLRTYRTLVIIAALCFVVAAFVVMYFKWSVQKSPADQTPARPAPAAADSMGIEYGADGRTLVLAGGGQREVLPYRIQAGRESEFKSKYDGKKFSSHQEAVSLLRTEEPTLLAERGATLLTPRGREFFKVEAQDVGSDTCERFLARVNRTLPPGVHNEIQQLRELNPGLRCDGLQSGDELQVYTGSVR